MSECVYTHTYTHIYTHTYQEDQPSTHSESTFCGKDSAYMYVCRNVYTHIHTPIYTHIYTRRIKHLRTVNQPSVVKTLLICMYVGMCIHTYIHPYIHTYIPHLRTVNQTSAYMYIHMCTCIHTYTYTYTHIHTRRIKHLRTVNQPSGKDTVDALLTGANTVHAALYEKCKVRG